MSKSGNFISVNIPFPPNYFLGLINVFALCIGILIIWQLVFMIFIKLFLSGCIIFYAYYLHRTHVQRKSPQSWINCQRMNANQWLLQNHQGKIFSGSLRQDIFISTWLIVLRWNIQVPDSQHSLPTIVNMPLFKWMLPNETWRKLSIILRWRS